MTPLTRPPDPRGWKRWLVRTLDLLYPAECAVCTIPLTGGRSLCEACENDLPRLTPPFCTICGEHFEGRIEQAFSCPNCSNLKFAFSFARPALVRDDRTRDMIHRLKYGRQIHLATDLAWLAAGAFQDDRLAPALAAKWPLVPVPLHRGRLRERHFNQAEEIARGLSRLTGMPVTKALRRVRATGHQTSLTRSQRLENLRGAFALTRPGRKLAESAPGVVLVDDVFTTGSTVDACAAVLRRAGIREIQVVTVMRG